MDDSSVIYRDRSHRGIDGGGPTWDTTTATENGPPESGPSQPTMMLMLPKRILGT